MGTSTGYSAPPSWAPLKGEVTRAAGAGALSRETARQIVQHYIRENGGARGMARGGAAVGAGKTAQDVAGRFSAFVADVAANGLDTALTNAGLAEFIGRPVTEILGALLDRLGGPASTIDDVDARNALARLQDELFGDAADAPEMEQVLTDTASQLESVLQDFFSHYLYEQFCRVFYERLVQRVGDIKAQSFLEEIESFLASTLENRTAGRDLSSIQWAQAEGQAILMEIMETTLNVFGN